MAKIVYQLRTEINPHPDLSKFEYEVHASIVGNQVIITVSTDEDDDLMKDEEFAGEKASDMLWELFEHDFRVYDENGKEATYED